MEPNAEPWTEPVLETLSNKIAEMALGLYFGEVAAKHLPEGRLKGKMLRLQELVFREFRRMPPSVRLHHGAARRRVLEFVNRMGWEHKSFAFPTLCNFLLGLYDRKPWGAALIPVLQDIYDYFDRAGNVRPASLWAAGHAADVWEETGRRTVEPV